MSLLGLQGFRTAIGVSLAGEDAYRRVEKEDFIRIAIVALAAMLCLLHVPFSNVIAIAATAIGGFPIFEEAFDNLRQGRMTMELSMSIALIAALAISEFFTALVIALFVLIAEVLEGLTMKRGRNAIEHLVSLLPKRAFVRLGDEIVERDLADVRPGDVVVIKPGASVPVDGTVVSGHSTVDQAAITGESMPVEKTTGSVVYAGTINESGTIDVRTTCVGSDTAFGKIIHAVETAEGNQAPVQKTADRLAGYLVYFAIGCAILTFLITHNARATISVVIVAGACGIAAGTPLAILGGVGLAARAGSIVKGGLYLELLSHIDTVVFDKTGTLTFGEPHVTEVETFSGLSANSVLELAAAAESVSEHPLGQAIVEQARGVGIKPQRPSEFQYFPGKGIICRLHNQELVVGNRSLLEEKHYPVDKLPQTRTDSSEVFVGQSGEIAGALYIADVVRPEAKQAVKDLQALGIRTVLLTGDSKPIAEAVGLQLGIEDVRSEMLPAEKQEYVRQLCASGRKVAMIGDGINDAPALVEATVGVAVGSGTDVARESADVVLIGSDLQRFVETLRIARRCMKVIMTNFVGTLLVDGIGVLLAAFALLSPLLAAFIHVSSELVFILNSARLLPAKATRSAELQSVQDAG